MSGSKGARELSAKIYGTGGWKTEEELAALIDSHLEPLLRAMFALRQAYRSLYPHDPVGVYKLPTSLTDFDAEAEKWKPGGSSTEDTAR